MNTFNGECIVTKPQKSIKASNDFFRLKCKTDNVISNRILFAFASLVNKSDLEQNHRFVEYTIPANSVINSDGGSSYIKVKKAAYILLDIKLEKSINNKILTVYNLFSKIHYEDGYITGEIHKDLIPFFLEVKERFTIISLHEYFSLTSTYSQKLYSFLKSWSDQKEKIVSIDFLHDFLCVTDSIKKDFRQFRTRILEKTYKEINTKTSMKYSWEPVKYGKRYKAIKFILHCEKKKIEKTKTSQPESRTPSSLKKISSRSITSILSQDQNVVLHDQEFIALAQAFPDSEQDLVAAQFIWGRIRAKNLPLPNASEVTEADRKGGLILYLRTRLTGGE